MLTPAGTPAKSASWNCLGCCAKYRGLSRCWSCSWLLITSLHLTLMVLMKILVDATPLSSMPAIHVSSQLFGC